MRKVLAGFFLLCAVSLVAHAQAPGGKRIQCWTDDKGNRSCGDSVPPQYSQKERELYNNQGVVVGKKLRQLSPAEAAEADRKVADEDAAAKRMQEQLAYDKFLTDTYNSSKELEAARALREQTFDGRLGLIQKSIADNEKTLTDLRGRADSQTKAGKKADARLLDQIQKFEVSLDDSKKSEAQLQSEKLKMVSKFNLDIERYKLLRPGH